MRLQNRTQLMSGQTQTAGAGKGRQKNQHRSPKPRESDAERLLGASAGFKAKAWQELSEHEFHDGKTKAVCFKHGNIRKSAPPFLAIGPILTGRLQRWGWAPGRPLQPGPTKRAPAEPHTGMLSRNRPSACQNSFSATRQCPKLAAQ